MRPFPALILTLALTSLTATAQANAQDFKTLLFGNLGPQATLEEIHHLVYGSSSEFFARPEGSSPEDFLRIVGENYSQITPLALYEAGRESSLSRAEAAAAAQSAEASLREAPLTVVVVTGIFGEFLETRAFEEVLEKGQNSSHGKRWRDTLEIYEREHGPQTDAQYRLMEGDVHPEPLSSLLAVSGIDDDSGRPLVNVVYLHTEAFSLETLGDIEKSAEIFNRRLNRYFEIMGAPGELAVLGYSRGTMISLEMLAQAKKSDETWLKNLRAMISVGGVTYGSALADKIAPHIKTFGELIEGLRPMTENTLPISEEMSFLEKLRISTQNAASIAKNSTVLAQNIAVSLENGIGLSDAVPGINLIEELKKNREVDLSSTRALLARIAASFDFSLAPIEFNFGMFSDPAVFNGNVEAHNENVRRYNDNLQKFQIISRAVALGIEQLSTEARLEWWRTHDVPVEGVKYYAIAGTMADPDASGEKTLIENPYSYNVGSPDQLELLANYRDFTGYSKKRLNDSQVAVDRVRFWPSLNAMLNSSNAAMKTEFLGVVGTHHWGLTLRTVIKLTSGKTNPFPREALLKSIAGSIALDRE